MEKKKHDLIILDMLLDMVTGYTFFFYIKSMPECADIPITIVSNTSKCNYRNLYEIDPNLEFLDKIFVEENLIK